MTALMVWLRTHPKVGRFAQATGQRVVRSFAASLVGSLTAGNVVTHVDIGQALTIAGSAAVVTLLLCLAGQASSGDGPAFGSSETTRR